MPTSQKMKDRPRPEFRTSRFGQSETPRTLIPPSVPSKRTIGEGERTRRHRRERASTARLARYRHKVVDRVRTGESGRIRCRCSRFRPSGRISRRTSSIARIRRQTRRLSRRKAPSGRDSRRAPRVFRNKRNRAGKRRGARAGLTALRPRRPIRASPGTTPDGGMQSRASLDSPRDAG